MDADPGKRHLAATALAIPDAALHSPAGMGEAMTQPIRILSVDDERDVEALLLQSFRKQVREGAFQFAFAHDGGAALETVKSSDPFDVILLDINMPVMDGLTFLGKLAEVPQDARVVMVSAYGDMSNLRVSMNRGAYDFVTKPVDMADLDATIRKTASEVRKYRMLSDEKRALERARGNLARYFSPQLAEYLAERHEPLGPVRRQDVAVLFADLVGFTTFAEKNTPERVIELLRNFHDRMSRIVFQHGGCLEKYIGDALCCTFGVLDQSPLDAHRAVRCGVAMVEAVAAWNGERVAAGEEPVQIGVGVNCGPAVIGDIGSEQTLAFATIGSTVNMASRLQDATRQIGASIVLSEAVVQAIENSSEPGLHERFAERGEFTPRGAARPMTICFNRQDFPLVRAAG